MSVLTYQPIQQQTLLMQYPILQIAISLVLSAWLGTYAGWQLRQWGFPLPEHDNRFGCVDGLRGYMALSVLAHHFIIWLQIRSLGGEWTVPSVPLFNELGAGAVALFFMTTGLVFFRRVLDGFLRTSWPAVFTTRVFRILPLVVASVVAVSLIAVSREGHGLSRADVPALAKWISAWSEPSLAGFVDAGQINAYVLWSLHFEWIFYLVLLPLAALLMDAIRSKLPSVTVPIALLLATLIGNLVHFWPNLTRWLPYFAVGMLAYEAHQRASVANRLRSRPVAVAAIALLLGAALAYPFPVGAALPAFAFFFICVACGNDMFGLLRTRGALVLGEISFSIYLLHGIVLSLFFVQGGWMTASLSAGALPFCMPLIAVAVVLLSALTYLGIERPAMRLGSHLARRWTHLQIRSRAAEVEFAP